MEAIKQKLFHVKRFYGTIGKAKKSDVRNEFDNETNKNPFTELGVIEDIDFRHTLVEKELRYLMFLSFRIMSMVLITIIEI